MTLQQPPSPGWYDAPDGTRRWWDGRAWGASGGPGAQLVPATSAPVSASPPPAATQWQQPAVVHHVQHSLKDSGVAYALAIFLGGFGAHRFYLGRPGSAIAMLLLWQVGLGTLIFGVGFVLCFAYIVWWIVDLCSLGGMVRATNASRVAAAAAMSRPYGY
jgi:TM2 domain-containing membrane protein YozV